MASLMINPHSPADIRNVISCCPILGCDVPQLVHQCIDGLTHTIPAQQQHTLFLAGLLVGVENVNWHAKESNRS
jgi:hypothetical protein